jgi:hypothetical protein
MTQLPFFTVGYRFGFFFFSAKKTHTHTQSHNSHTHHNSFFVPRIVFLDSYFKIPIWFPLIRIIVTCSGGLCGYAPSGGCLRIYQACARTADCCSTLHCRQNVCDRYVRPTCIITTSLYYYIIMLFTLFHTLAVFLVEPSPPLLRQDLQTPFGSISLPTNLFFF